MGAEFVRDIRLLPMNNCQYFFRERKKTEPFILFYYHPRSSWPSLSLSRVSSTNECISLYRRTFKGRIRWTSDREMPFENIFCERPCSQVSRLLLHHFLGFLHNTSNRRIVSIVRHFQSRNDTPSSSSVPLSPLAVLGNKQSQ